MRLGLPYMIGDVKITLITEVVSAKICLLIGNNSLERSMAILKFGKRVAALLGCKVKMCKAGARHFCIELLKENMSKFEVSSLKQP